MTLIWILLSLHFFYYIPFLLFIIAFTRIISSSKTLSYWAIVLWAAIVIADFTILYANFTDEFIYHYLIACYLVSLLTTLILWVCGKLDIKIWLLCTILFSPVSMPIAWLFAYLITPKTGQVSTLNYEQS